MPPAPACCHFPRVSHQSGMCDNDVNLGTVLISLGVYFTTEKNPGKSSVGYLQNALKLVMALNDAPHLQMSSIIMTRYAPNRYSYVLSFVSNSGILDNIHVKKF